MRDRVATVAKWVEISLVCAVLAGIGIWASVAYGEERIAGPVMAVHDGDTLRIGPHVIRLANIDAPELSQDYGPTARAALVNICAGQWAEATVTTRDRYRRAVATVRCGQVDANRTMVAAGYAWVYTRYHRDATLPAIEDKARAERHGLWATDRPVPPWIWRTAQRAQTGVKG